MMTSVRDSKHAVSSKEGMGLGTAMPESIAKADNTNMI